MAYGHEWLIVSQPFLSNSLPCHGGITGDVLDASVEGDTQRCGTESCTDLGVSLSRVGMWQAALHICGSRMWYLLLEKGRLILGEGVCSDTRQNSLWDKLLSHPGGQGSDVSLQSQLLCNLAVSLAFLMTPLLFCLSFLVLVVSLSLYREILCTLCPVSLVETSHRTIGLCSATAKILALT